MGKFLDLLKALHKKKDLSRLVQVQRPYNRSGKTVIGTFYVKPGDVKDTDRVIGNKDVLESHKKEASKPKPILQAPTDGKFSEKYFTELAKTDKGKALEYLKSNGIRWTEHKDPRINWLHAKQSFNMKVKGINFGFIDSSFDMATFEKLRDSNKKDKSKAFEYLKEHGLEWDYQSDPRIDWMFAMRSLRVARENPTSSKPKEKPDMVQIQNKPVKGITASISGKTLSIKLDSLSASITISNKSVSTGVAEMLYEDLIDDAKSKGIEVTFDEDLASDRINAEVVESVITSKGKDYTYDDLYTAVDKALSQYKKDNPAPVTSKPQAAKSTAKEIKVKDDVFNAHTVLVTLTNSSPGEYIKLGNGWRLSMEPDGKQIRVSGIEKLSDKEIQDLDVKFTDKLSASGERYKTLSEKIYSASWPILDVGKIIDYAGKPNQIPKSQLPLQTKAASGATVKMKKPKSSLPMPTQDFYQRENDKGDKVYISEDGLLEVGKCYFDGHKYHHGQNHGKDKPHGWYAIRHSSPQYEMKRREHTKDFTFIYGSLERALYHLS